MALVVVAHGQDLRVLDGRFSYELVANEIGPLDDDLLAIVRGPDGQTVVRRCDDAADGDWAALWSGDEPHDPLAVGMLSGIVAPLAAAEIPVMVASTLHADLIFVPVSSLDRSISALRIAGHQVTRTLDGPDTDRLAR